VKELLSYSMDEAAKYALDNLEQIKELESEFRTYIKSIKPDLAKLKYKLKKFTTTFTSFRKQFKASLVVVFVNSE